jgi:hypothetical protein
MTNELLLAISAAVAAFGVLIGAVIAIYRVARRIGDVLGVDKEGRTISDRLGRVEHQLWENGGSSLADRVNSIEKHTIKIGTELRLIKNIYLNIQSSSFSEDIEKRDVLDIQKPTRKSRKRNAS